MLVIFMLLRIVIVCEFDCFNNLARTFCAVPADSLSEQSE